jgi:hypothetical protein
VSPFQKRGRVDESRLNVLTKASVMLLTLVLSRRALGGSPQRDSGYKQAARAATVPQILGSTQHSLECLSARFLVTTTVEKLSKIGDAIARAQDFTDLYCDLARTFAGAEATPLNQPEDADNPSLTPAADRQLGHQVSAQRRAPERHNGLVFPLAARLPDF